jgi:hypothetical protein
LDQRYRLAAGLRRQINKVFPTHWSFLLATTWIGRIAMVVLPPIVYFIAYRWAIAVQRSDREVLEHGVETGVIRRLPHGAYVEVLQSLGPVPLVYRGAPVPKRVNKLVTVSDSQESERAPRGVSA